MKAGIGAGIWVEHANILPLPLRSLAYRGGPARTIQD